jgi:nicotinic acid mononucleotide adenylyltransferase
MVDASVPAARITPSIFLIDAPTADVSSTAIRQRLAGGGSIAGMVPEPVRQHIEQHALYAASDPGAAGVNVPRTSAAGRLHGED